MAYGWRPRRGTTEWAAQQIERLLDAEARQGSPSQRRLVEDAAPFAVRDYPVASTDWAAQQLRLIDQRAARDSLARFGPGVVGPQGASVRRFGLTTLSGSGGDPLTGAHNRGELDPSALARSASFSPPSFKKVNVFVLSPPMDAETSKHDSRFVLDAGVSYRAGVVVMREDARTFLGRAADAFMDVVTDPPMKLQFDGWASTADGDFADSIRIDEDVAKGGWLYHPMWRDHGGLRGPGRVVIRAANLGPYYARVTVGLEPIREQNKPG